MNQKTNKGLRDVPRSRIPSQEYADNWERIFGKKFPNRAENPSYRKEGKK